MDSNDRFARGHRIPIRVVGGTPDVAPADAVRIQIAEPELEPATVVDVLAPQSEPDWRDQALRLQAEMVNFRKRQDRRVEDATGNEKTRLLRQLLPVLDNLDRLMAHKEGGQQDALWQGIELTYRELSRFLESEGVSRGAAVGRVFDPAEHEAVATIRSRVPPGTVVEELRPGYFLRETLLRPAQVVVAAE